MDEQTGSDFGKIDTGPCPPTSQRLRETASQLQNALENLDAIDERMAAIYVSMALDLIKSAASFA